MVALNAQTVGALAPEVGVPAYDPRTVGIGIVHFGVGGFHRAHQAMYVDRLLGDGVAGWAICGVGVREADAAIRDALRAQDNLYTLVTESPDGVRTATVIGAIAAYLYAPDDPAAVLARLDDDATRIVSLTITEGGYSVDDVTGTFAPHDADTLADLADDAPWRSAPRSVLGYLVAALDARRTASRMPFTIMSCDNIQGNGAVTRTAVCGFAARKDPELAQWISENVAFPPSMVDRITPATSDEVRAAVAERFGVEDLWPVRSESFTQWVVEDHFPLGRPPLETVGVQLVDDVEPYELMKLRLLNASHQAMAYVGLLAGLTYAHEACQDPAIREFLIGYMRDEGSPSVPPVPGEDVPAYCATLMARFGNEAVRDTMERLAFDGSERISKFLLPVLAHQLETGGSIRHCVMVIAAWSRWLDDRIERTDPAVQDHRATELLAAVRAERETAGAFLPALRSVFGDLADDAAVRAGFLEARAALEKGPLSAALGALAG